MKAIACELPATSGVPLSRWSTQEVAREAIARGIVAHISGTTIWRWLSEDAIRPFYHRSWIFPRDPDFAKKASWGWASTKAGGKVWRLGMRSTLSLPTRRPPPRLAAAPTSPCQLTKDENPRAWNMSTNAKAYLATWGVHRAKLFGRCEAKNGIEPFGRLVDEVMSAEPYASADRVFWVVDNEWFLAPRRCLGD